MRRGGNTARQALNRVYMALRCLEGLSVGYNQGQYQEGLKRSATRTTGKREKDCPREMLDFSSGRGTMICVYWWGETLPSNLSDIVLSRDDHSRYSDTRIFRHFSKSRSLGSDTIWSEGSRRRAVGRKQRNRTQTKRRCKASIGAVELHHWTIDVR